MVIIKGVQKTSLIDYPGKMCTIVFLGGCNFRCSYCQNPDLINNNDKLPDINENKLFSLLEERKEWIDGVCITGGEPTIHKGLIGFIAKIKTRGGLVKLDTNGTNPELLKELLDKKLLDYIAMDYKAPLDKYYQITKTEVNTENIKKSVEIIKKSGIDYEFRSTILPAMHTKEDIIKMAKELEGSKIFYLQEFRNMITLDNKLSEERGFSHKEMADLAELCNKYVRTELRI